VTPLWRRKETLNEKLLREGGYSPDGAAIEASVTDDPYEPTIDPGPDPASGRSGEVPDALTLRSAGPARLREPHVIASAEAPELSGDSYTFTTLPEGSMMVDDSCEDDLSRLADVVEEHLSRPYRAEAVRHRNGSWLVSAWPIRVARIATGGNELELTSVAGERTYTVDGKDVDVALVPPELAQLGEARRGEYAVHALRLDGDLWEIERYAF
jgi:hypothetical protein